MADFKEEMLSKSELELFEFSKERINDLQESRKEEHYGTSLEDLWAEADRDYIPHRLGTRKKRAGYIDEDKEWRGPLVRMGDTNWQSDVSQPNPFTKIQIALSILVDQNPSGVFTATSSKFESTTNLIKQLYDRSWDQAKSKQQLKLFVHNLAKYGWAAARTYPLRITRKVKELEDYNQEKPSESTYIQREVVEYNDIFRENLDPWNVWIDDMAKPNNSLFLRDWAWRKIYSLESFKEEFGSWPNAKFVKPGGITTDKIDPKNKIKKEFKDRKLVEVLFYENKPKDLFVVIANGVPVVISPLPISDSRGNKKLSLWHTYWNLRHAESPYGIGIWEAIRNDQGILDRINNMSIDQLTLSIYKMFFYQGTNQLTETGDIPIAPGVGKQTLDPKNMQFLDVPGPGKESVDWRQLIRQDLDEASGITDPLLGNVTGKTAFEVAQAKESALKRLKTPLENITDALDNEAYISISLMQLLYSIPEVISITESSLIDDYLSQIQGDLELFSRGEDGSFQAYIYPEFPLNLDEDNEGNLIETDKTRFFRIKPRFLRWEGIVNVKSQSVLTPSKQLDKALDLEMYNMLIPLLVQPPEVYQKVAKNIVKLYDKDPREVLPDVWLQSPEELQKAAQAAQPLVVPSDGGQQAGPQQSPSGPSPAQSQKPSGQQSLISKVGERLGSLSPFK